MSRMCTISKLSKSRDECKKIDKIFYLPRRLTDCGNKENDDMQV